MAFDRIEEQPIADTRPRSDLDDPNWGGIVPAIGTDSPQMQRKGAHWERMVVRQWIGLGDVEHRLQTSGRQFGDERVMVEQRTPRRVDDRRPGREPGELFRTDRPALAAAVLHHSTLSISAVSSAIDGRASGVAGSQT